MTPALPLLVAASAFVVALFASRRAPRLWLAAVLVSCLLALAAAVLVLASSSPSLSPSSAPSFAWDWRSPFAFCGDPLHFRLDALGAFFLALVSVVGGAGAVYARAYWSDLAHPRTAALNRLWWTVLLSSLVVVLLAAHGLQFLLGWELFTVAAYFLVTLDRQRDEVRAAGWLYLGASHVGTICLFAFFAALAAATNSWELGPLRDRPELAPLFWLALAGFGLKAGMFPLHVWLPSAHANAPSHVSAILSGVTIKLGIYGLARFSGWLPVPAAAAWTVAILGVASAVLGVAFALGQHDLKRLLAYHSVENIGIILIGLGFALIAAGSSSPDAAAWGRLALAGGLLHVWNHGLFKSLLFLGAGSVLHATGTREMSRLGGLWRALPWTATLFALGAAAISGLPPLNGFVSEWLVYLGLFDAVLARGLDAWAAVPAAILLGVTGALALACFVKVCGIVFLGAPRSAAAAHAHESPAAMRGPMLLLAACCVAIGLAPFAVWPAVARAVVAWQPAWQDSTVATSAASAVFVAPPSLAVLGWAHVALAAAAGLAALWLLRRARRGGLTRALTWDCGYAAPSSRMQYTAGGFAATLVEWFAWILRPARHEQRPEENFAARAHRRDHTPETVLKHLVHPLAGFIMRASDAARRLQHGRLQAYLFYLLIGVAALAVIAMTGNTQ